MISIIHQGDHRHDVYHSGQDIGCIDVSANPYHNQHCYLNPGLMQYGPAIARELFSLLRKEIGRPIHYAFVEPDEVGYEIAYVGTTDLSFFCGFAGTLVSELFRKCGTLTAECDDTDPAATILKHQFRTSSDDSYDTYILE